ncbi:MAG: hypothetical protein AB2697_19765 [Candidatus Thiodiazotropha endolucinida]
MIRIPERPEGQRYWVVRAQGGDFVQHFRQGSVVAIGHLNEFNFPEAGNSPFIPELDNLFSKIRTSEAKTEIPSWKARAQNRFNQVKTFIAEMSVGDLVITIDSGLLMVGRIIGHPKIIGSPVRVVHDPKENKFTEMAFDLRREVQWGPIIKRKNLPTAMKRSISARQTVFNVDEYWSYIYHLLYPAFIYNCRLYLSTRIEQEEPISNFSISQLLLVLTELEVISRSIEDIDDPALVNFSDFFDLFLERDDFILATTAEFMSPGSIWSYLGFSNKSGRGIVIGCLLFGMMFGVEIGPIKVDGVIHKELREKIMDEFNIRLRIHKIEKIKKRLQLTIPKYNTTPLEDSSNDSPPDPGILELLKEV